MIIQLKKRLEDVRLENERNNADHIYEVFSALQSYTNKIIPTDEETYIDRIINPWNLEEVRIPDYNQRPTAAASIHETLDVTIPTDGALMIMISVGNLRPPSITAYRVTSLQSVKF